MRNLFAETTMRTLKSNKKKTLATFIGVVVFVMLMSVVVSTAGSLMYLKDTNIKQTQGNWIVELQNIPPSMEHKLAEQNIDYIKTTQLGYSLIDESINPNKQYMRLVAVGDNIKDVCHINLVSGRMPKAENEIVVTENMLNAMSHSYTSGDVLTCNLGIRINPFSGEELTNKDEYNSKEEVFVPMKMNATFNVVGVCKNISIEPIDSCSYVAITSNKTKTNIPSTTYTYLDKKQYNKGKEIVKDYYPSDVGVKYNKSEDTISNSWSENAGFISLLLGTFFVMVVVGGYMLLHNAFNIYIAERKKQNETLMLIGLTKKQLRKNSLYEATYFAIISIPLGIILGLTMTKLLLKATGKYLADIVVSSNDIELPLKVTPVVVFVIVICSFAVVLIAALKASNSLKTLTVINEDAYKYKRHKKEHKTMLFKRFANIDSIAFRIARRNYEANKKSYRYAFISLVLSMTVFITINAVSNLGEEIINTQYSHNAGYDIIYKSNNVDEVKEAYLTLKNIDGVSESKFYTNATMFTENIIDGDRTDIVILTERDYNDYVQKLKQEDDDIVVSTDEAVCVSNHKITKEAKSQSITGIVGGQTTTFNVVAYTQTVPDGIIQNFNQHHKLLIISETLSQTAMASVDKKTLGGVAIFKSDDNTTTYAQMEQLLSKNEIETKNLNNIGEVYDDTKNILLLITMLSYCFVALLIVIAMANVFNTISANISNRKQELKILLNVGMSKKLARKTVIYEYRMFIRKVLEYTWFLAITLVVSINISQHESIDKIVVPIGSVIICMLILACVTCIIMAYVVRKFNSMVEQIEN